MITLKVSAGKTSHLSWAGKKLLLPGWAWKNFPMQTIFQIFHLKLFKRVISADKIEKGSWTTPAGYKTNQSRKAGTYFKYDFMDTLFLEWRKLGDWIRYCLKTFSDHPSKKPCELKIKTDFNRSLYLGLNLIFNLGTWLYLVWPQVWIWLLSWHQHVTVEPHQRETKSQYNYKCSVLLT